MKQNEWKRKEQEWLQKQKQLEHVEHKLKEEREKFERERKNELFRRSNEDGVLERIRDKCKQKIRGLQKQINRMTVEIMHKDKKIKVLQKLNQALIEEKTKLKRIELQLEIEKKRRIIMDEIFRQQEEKYKQIQREKKEEKKNKLKLFETKRQERCEELKARKLDPRNYDNWNTSQHVINWIVSLQNGYFVKYKNVLATELKNKKITGRYLSKMEIDKNQIHSWGVNNDGDCIKLLNHILHIKSWNGDKKTLIDPKNIHNMFVICVGIANYNDLKPLPDVPTDMENYQRVFGRKYGYTVVANDDLEHVKQFGYYLTSTKLFQFLLKCKDKITASICNQPTLFYDGIIVTISSHGYDNGIICSDGSNMSYNELRRIFYDNLLAKIPRIFLVDACRSSAHDFVANDFYYTVNECKKFCVTVFGAGSGEYVRGGKVSKSVTTVLENCNAQNVYQNLDSMLNMAKKYIGRANNGKLTLTCDPEKGDIFDIVLKKNDNLRGTEEDDSDDEEDETAERTAVNALLSKLGTEFKDYQTSLDENGYTELNQLLDNTDKRLQKSMNASHLRTIQAAIKTKERSTQNIGTGLGLKQADKVLPRYSDFIDNKSWSCAPKIIQDLKKQMKVFGVSDANLEKFQDEI
eukprot:93769_1